MKSKVTLALTRAALVPTKSALNSTKSALNSTKSALDSTKSALNSTKSALVVDAVGFSFPEVWVMCREQGVTAKFLIIYFIFQFLLPLLPCCSEFVVIMLV